MCRPPLHPACKIFPTLGPAELQELADDIAANGLRNPIVMLNGKILDGRNRWEACKLANVEPRCSEFDGDDPVSWVVSQNLVRRHLTPSQRAVVAFELLPIVEKEAKERQRRSNSYRGNGRLGKKFPNRENNGKATAIAATMAKTNSAYVQAVKAISLRAPKVVDLIRSGRVNVPQATKLAELSPAERREVLQRANGRPLTTGTIRSLTTMVRNDSRNRTEQANTNRADARPDHDVITGNMRILWKRLEDNSADLFFSDPIYQQAEAYDKLAELAAAKLVPGGLCLAYTGQLYLPANMAAMRKHLDYWWLFCVQFGGQHSAIYSQHLQNCWKPILAFAKPPISPAPAWLRDSIAGGGRDKEFHPWGKHESEAEYLIQRLTEPGALVVDCYCGGGTVPAACKATGRRWLATEVDGATATAARKRLADMHSA
jgi:hypothetical protein